MAGVEGIEKQTKNGKVTRILVHNTYNMAGKNWVKRYTSSMFDEKDN